MLRLPSERLSIAMTPGCIGIRRKKGAAATHSGVIRYPLPGHEPQWQAAVDALSTWFDRVQPQRPRVSLLVSSAFVRYALVPWAELCLRPQQDTALILARFEQDYGDMSRWRVVADAGSYGGARIACAMPAELIDRLDGACRARCFRQGSMQPYFVAAWNHFAKTIVNGCDRRSGTPAASLFAVAEGGTLLLGMHTGSGWTRLRSLRVAGAGALVEALTRERLLLGQPLALYLHAPGLSGTSGESLQAVLPAGTELHWLEASAEPLAGEVGALVMAGLDAPWAN